MKNEDQAMHGDKMQMYSASELRSPMKRTTITLPDEIYEDAIRWADLEGRPTANLISFLVETAVKKRFPEKYTSVENTAQ